MPDLWRESLKTRLNICGNNKGADQPAPLLFAIARLFSAKKRLTNLNGEQNESVISGLFSSLILSRQYIDYINISTNKAFKTNLSKSYLYKLQSCLKKLCYIYWVNHLQSLSYIIKQLQTSFPYFIKK